MLCIVKLVYEIRINCVMKMQIMIFSVVIPWYPTISPNGVTIQKAATTKVIVIDLPNKFNHFSQWHSVLKIPI